VPPLIKILRYRQILENILAAQGEELMEGLKAFIEASEFAKNNIIFVFIYTHFLILVVNENVSLVISRQLLTDVCNHLQKLPEEVSMSVSHFTLDKVCGFFT